MRLEIPVSAGYCYGYVARLRMPASDDFGDPRKALALEAGPLRRSLSAYFRRRIREPGEVEDLVQEVFARIVARDNTKPVENLTGYIFQIASSVLMDRARRRRSRRADAHLHFEPDLHGGADFDPERILSGREDLTRVMAALLSLPELTRTIFVLHRLEGRKQREIALQLGISIKSVEKHMVRAGRHLIRSLGEEP
jgi:RNA polymerase sigma-70 factor (ECF subfamily)